MANQQTSSGAQTAQQGASTRGTSTATDKGSAIQAGTSGTGIRDATYNLISVVYHALQGAETYKMYEEDVERTQDDELAQFFRQCHEDEKKRAQRGKELLARHLQKDAGGAPQQGGGGQQLQSGGSSRQQGGGASSRSTQQSGGSSNQKTQAVPGDQYGNTQSTSSMQGEAPTG